MASANRKPPKSVALIVGVDHYEDPEIQSLQCAENDCIKLAGFLEHAAGYDKVELLRSAGSQKVLDTAAAMARGLPPGGTFLFFFAGHGVEHENKHLLLCPGARNKRLKFMVETVPVDLLREETDAPGISRVFILDACRSDLLRTREASGCGLRGEKGLRDIVATAKPVAGASLAILCSCTEGRQARELASRSQGLFTAALLDVFKEAHDAGAEVQLSDALEAKLAERMACLAREYGVPADQQPWIQRSGPPPVLLGGHIVAENPSLADVERQNTPHTKIEFARPPAAPSGMPAALPGSETPARPFPAGSATGWFWLHPDYARELASHVSPEAAFLDGPAEGMNCVVRGVNGVELVQAGLACGCRYQNGKCFAVTDIEAVVANARLDILEAFSRGLPPGATPEPYCLYVLAIEKNRERARYELSKLLSESRLGVYAVLALGRLFDDAAEARRYLKREEGREVNALFSGSFAKMWGKIFSDEREARQSLKEEETKTESAEGWTDCARAWMYLFRDDRAAFRCIKEAEDKAAQSSDWRSCAIAWKELFSDEREAKRCLKETESKASGVSEWIVCAKTRKEVFFENGEAERCLKEAEAKAREAREWRWCAETWVNLFPDDHGARRCLKGAEDKAENGLDWRSCAEAWKELLSDDGEARRCLKQAEEKAKDTSDWVAYAKAWKELLSDNGEARHCLEKAEEIDTAEHDWMQSARFSDRIRVAEAWKELLSEDGEARRCLEQAEDKAEDSHDWRSCAETWKRSLSDDSNARRCLKQAEDKTEDAFDWRGCAETWKEVLCDGVEAKRCLKEAERKAEGADELLECAEAWHEFDVYSSEGRICIRRAEKSVKDAAEWVRCAKDWNLFHLKEDARRCLKKAESKAESASDWESCAEAWKEIFSDEKESERCEKEADEKKNTPPEESPVDSAGEAPTNPEELPPLPDAPPAPQELPPLSDAPPVPQELPPLPDEVDFGENVPSRSQELPPQPELAPLPPDAPWEQWQAQWEYLLKRLPNLPKLSELGQDIESGKTYAVMDAERDIARIVPSLEKDVRESMLLQHLHTWLSKKLDDMRDLSQFGRACKRVMAALEQVGSGPEIPHHSTTCIPPMAAYNGVRVWWEKVCQNSDFWRKGDFFDQATAFQLAGFYDSWVSVNGKDNELAQGVLELLDLMDVKPGQAVKIGEVLRLGDFKTGCVYNQDALKSASNIREVRVSRVYFNAWDHGRTEVRSSLFDVVGIEELELPPLPDAPPNPEDLPPLPDAPPAPQELLLLPDDLPNTQELPPLPAAPPVPQELPPLPDAPPNAEELRPAGEAPIPLSEEYGWALVHPCKAAPGQGVFVRFLPNKDRFLMAGGPALMVNIEVERIIHGHEETVIGGWGPYSGGGGGAGPAEFQVREGDDWSKYTSFAVPPAALNCCCDIVISVRQSGHKMEFLLPKSLNVSKKPSRPMISRRWKPVLRGRRLIIPCYGLVRRNVGAGCRNILFVSQGEHHAAIVETEESLTQSSAGYCELIAKAPDWLGPGSVELFIRCHSFGMSSRRSGAARFRIPEGGGDLQFEHGDFPLPPLADKGLRFPVQAHELPDEPPLPPMPQMTPPQVEPEASAGIVREPALKIIVTPTPRWYLKEAEGKADSTGKWTDCAKAWKEQFADDGEARRCLKEAEGKAEYVSHCTACAEAWKQLVSDDHEARRCLKEAEGKAKITYGWTVCAQAWKRLFSDDGEARRCLKEAEGKAKNSSDWTYCAEACRSLFSDDREARRRLKVAEGKAENSSDWVNCAAAWMNLFSDDLEAHRCLKEMESRAESTGDWKHCAEAWNLLFHDDRGVWCCLKEAEGKAEDSSDWGVCARAWKELCSNDGEARRCLKEAEGKAKYRSDWEVCARQWKELCSDDGEAQRCLKEAEDKEDESELVAARNEADEMCYSTESYLEEQGDKVSSGVREKAEAAVKEVRELLKDKSIEKSKLDRAVSNLESASHCVAEEVFLNTDPNLPPLPQ